MWLITGAGSEDDSEGSDYEELPRGGRATASGRDEELDLTDDEDAEGVCPFRQNLYVCDAFIPMTSCLREERSSLANAIVMWL